MLGLLNQSSKTPSTTEQNEDTHFPCVRGRASLRTCSSAAKFRPSCFGGDSGLDYLERRPTHLKSQAQQPRLAEETSRALPLAQSSHVRFTTRLAVFHTKPRDQAPIGRSPAYARHRTIGGPTAFEVLAAPNCPATTRCARNAPTWSNPGAIDSVVVSATDAHCALTEIARPVCWRSGRCREFVDHRYGDYANRGDRGPTQAGVTALIISAAPAAVYHGSSAAGPAAHIGIFFVLFHTCVPASLPDMFTAAERSDSCAVVYP